MKRRPYQEVVVDDWVSGRKYTRLETVIIRGLERKCFGGRHSLLEGGACDESKQGRAEKQGNTALEGIHRRFVSRDTNELFNPANPAF